jgi:hypothetical protein
MFFLNDDERNSVKKVKSKKHNTHPSISVKRISLRRPNPKAQQEVVKRHPGIHNRLKKSQAPSHKNINCLAGLTNKSGLNNESDQKEWFKQ